LIRKVYDESKGPLVSVKPGDVRSYVISQLSELRNVNGRVEAHITPVG